MARYLLTHSLLYSWLYLMKENPYEDMETETDPIGDFLRVLRREPTETSEAMQRGIDFEDLVTRIAEGWLAEDDKEHPYYEPAYLVAEKVKGGTFQYKAMKEKKIAGVEFLLYGRLDVLKAGKIYDIKYTTNYDRGKFLKSTQHPMYFELIPEADEFTYLISNGKEQWEETYRREETEPIDGIVTDFVFFLRQNGFWDTYKKYWLSKDEG